MQPEARREHQILALQTEVLLICNSFLPGFGPCSFQACFKLCNGASAHAPKLKQAYSSMIFYVHGPAKIGAKCVWACFVAHLFEHPPPSHCRKAAGFRRQRPGAAAGGASTAKVQEEVLWGQGPCSDSNVRGTGWRAVRPKLSSRFISAAAIKMERTAASGAPRASACNKATCPSSNLFGSALARSSLFTVA